MKTKPGRSSGTTKPFLSPAQMGSAAAEVVRLAQKEKQEIALVGGYALQFLGSRRMTTDVDFIASGLLAGLARGPALAFGGEATQTSRGVPVDLIVRRDQYRKLYAAALDLTIMAPSTKMLVPMVRPEVLLVMKLVAARPKDQIDFAFLATEVELDMKLVRSIAKKYLGVYAVDDIERNIEVAKWQAEREARKK